MSKVRTIFFLVFCSPFFAFSGQGTVGEMLDKSLDELSKGRYESSISLAEQAFFKAKRKNDRYQMVKAKGTLGYIGIEVGDYASAQINTSDALNYLRKLDTVDLYHETAYLEYLALISFMQGDHQRATSLYQAAYNSAVNYISENRAYAEEWGDTDWLYKLPLQKAKNLRMLGEYEEAGDLLLTVLEESEFKNDDAVLAEVINQLGLIKMENQEYLSAQNLFGRLAFSSNDKIDDHTRAAAMHNLAWAYTEQNDLEKASDYYRQALKLKRTYGASADTEFLTLLDLGEVEFNKKDYQSAIQIWNEAITVYDQFDNNPDLFKIYDWLGKAHREIKSEESSRYSDLYVASMSTWIEAQSNRDSNPELAVFNTKIDNIIAAREASARRLKDIQRYWPYAAMALFILALFIYQLQIALNRRRDRQFENSLKSERAVKADEILKQIRRD